MTIKLLFDENIAIKVVKALTAAATILAPDVEIAYRPEFTGRYSVPDNQWGDRVAEEGWILITADRGRTNRGIRLPRMCLDKGIRHVLAGTSTHRLREIPKLASLLAVWDDLLAVSTAPAGSRFRWFRSNESSRIELFTRP